MGEWGELGGGGGLRGWVNVGGKILEVVGVSG